MAGSITLGNEHQAAFASTTLKSVSKRCTIATLTNADALDTGIDIPAGAMPLTCAMKLITRCDSSDATLSIGYTGVAAGYMAVKAVGTNGTEGTVYVGGAAASLGAINQSAVSILLTGATTNPATTNVVVDVEIVYAMSSMA